MADLISVPCNLCGSDLFASAIVAHRGVRKVVCLRCGFIYLSPRPKHVDYSLYKQSYSDEFLADQHGPFEVTARQRAHFVGVRLGLDEPLLDFGCGYGHFLWMMRGMGYRNVVGVEPSIEERRFAQEKLSLGGVIYPDQDGPQGEVKMITLFHVLEHLENPLATLRWAHDRLVDGGYIVIEVPDATNLPVDFMEHFYMGSGQHRCWFTPKTLVDMLERAGFSNAGDAHPCSTALYPANLRVVGLKRKPHEHENTSLAAASAHQRNMEMLALRVDEIACRLSRGAFAIYGAGMHTLGLMDLCPNTKRAKVIIDDDPQKWGMCIEGVPIRAPSALEFVDSVLISSLGSEKVIAEKLKGCGKEVVTIYERNS